MQQNGRFRPKKTYFTQVSNSALRDPELSTRAKGLYAIIQSYITIPNFILYKKTLKDVVKEKEKAFESMWKELKDQGYLLQYKTQKPDGTFCYEYELLDKKNVELAKKINGNFVNTMDDENENKNENNQTPKKGVVDEKPDFKGNSPDPQKGGGGSCRGWIKEVYNNTNINNTYPNNTYSFIHSNELSTENKNKEMNEGLNERKIEEENKLLYSKLKELNLNAVYNDLTTVQAITDALIMIYTSENLLGHNKAIIRQNFHRINLEVIDQGLWDFNQAARKVIIKNTVKYLASCIYSALWKIHSQELYIDNKIKENEKNNE